jgi:hypothetical protein
MRVSPPGDSHADRSYLRWGLGARVDAHLIQRISRVLAWQRTWALRDGYW